MKPEMGDEAAGRLTRVLYRALLRGGREWVKLNEQAQKRGPREEAGLLQDLALRSVKANSSGWTETLPAKSKDFAKTGTKFLLEADDFLSRGCVVDGERGSFVYHGIEGLRAEFRRPSASAEEAAGRLDLAMETVRWLSAGNMCAQEICSMLEPRNKAPQIKYSIGDILWHKEYGWRGVVYGWSERCELGDGWLEQNDAQDKADQPFYNLLCNDGKLRYGSQLTHDRVQGPLEFLSADAKSSDIVTAQKYLDLYFHQFSNAHAAYIPNAHLARRYPEARWQALEQTSDSHIFDEDDLHFE